MTRIQEQTLKTYIFLPLSNPKKNDNSFERDFKDKISVICQEFKNNMTHQIKSTLCESMDLMVSKTPPHSFIDSGILNKSLEKSSETQKEVRKLKNQICRKCSCR